MELTGAEKETMRKECVMLMQWAFETIRSICGHPPHTTENVLTPGEQAWIWALAEFSHNIPRVVSPFVDIPPPLSLSVHWVDDLRRLYSLYMRHNKMIIHSRAAGWTKDRIYLALKYSETINKCLQKDFQPLLFGEINGHNKERIERALTPGTFNIKNGDKKHGISPRTSDTMKSNYPEIAHHVTECINISCPCCREALLIISPGSITVCNRETWLQDGDTIFGVYTKLSPEKRNPDGFTYELLTGECPACKNEYYAIQLNMMNSPDSEVHDIIRWNSECELKQNYFCSKMQNIQWLVSKFHTPKGIMLSHTFGPFHLHDPGDVKTIHGVTACQGGSVPWVRAQNIILEAWDTARLLLNTLTQNNYEHYGTSDANNDG